jgi:hypothetical protein
MEEFELYGRIYAVCLIRIRLSLVGFDMNIRFTCASEGFCLLRRIEDVKVRTIIFLFPQVKLKPLFF